MSLFDTDFSLFGGDLLFPPPTDSIDEVVTEPQDGLKTFPESDHVDWQKNENNIGQDVLSIEAVSGELLQDWLDTPVDLLNLFSQDNILSTTNTTSLNVNVQINDVKTESPGLEALKSLTEEIALELSTEADAQQVVADVTNLSGQNTGDVYDTGLGLLELLTSGVNPDSSVSEIADLDLMHIDTSPNLSPMSPEDVETILSSGPTSPVSCTTERSFQSLVSPDNSLIDFTIMEHENSLSEDLVELTQMVQESNSSSDSDYPVHVRKSRPTPYERNKKQVLQESVQTAGNSKILDRKLRKKQQNKDAATRYRQKKKMEQDIINKEVAGLESHNKNLKDKVDQMTKEIQYLKNLLIDVQKARAKRVKSK